MLLRLFAAACCAAFLSLPGALAQAQTQAPAQAPAPAPAAAPSSVPTPDTPTRPPRGRHARAAATPAAADSTAAPAAAPAPGPAPAAARSAALPAGTKINVNTASAAQLDSLPSIGKARLKAIMDERAKAPFKDWDDFERRMQHTSVNKGVQAKIKDYLVF